MATPQSPLGTSRDSSGIDTAAWQLAVEAIQLDEEGLREAYVAAVEDSKYDSAELEEVHTLAEKAQQTLDPRFGRFILLIPSIFAGAVELQIRCDFKLWNP